MKRIRAALIFIMLLVPAASAQTELPGFILVVDRDALFTRTIFGNRILADVDKATEFLVAENRRIESELVAEERALTDQRPTLEPADFRDLADAFDEKVQSIRAQQQVKSEEIGAALDEARLAYFQAVVPILAELLRENRAVVMLEKRDVLISASLIDVTDQAVERIDARLGDGSGIIGPVAVPEE